ncbi:phage tail protein [Serratia marcescens]|uniref:phage tail fiber protein n=1 Tax=Serratia marcescens TaxID=615 RepID=UPI00298E0676|nr:phage tail protein [Serratia marcescens]MDW7733811.1 phage tail protein [Serratia marcescens]
MPAGTITLKNNSAAVTGSGTAFSTELKANDFIVVTVGQTVYTLGVKSVESNTALTLVRNFDGPSAGGLAWTPIPYGAMVTITAQTHAYTTEAIRGLLLDKKNWQQVFSGTGNITVTLPDGSTFTGPAWNSFTTSLNQKAEKKSVDDLSTKVDAKAEKKSVDDLSAVVAKKADANNVIKPGDNGLGSKHGFVGVNTNNIDILRSNIGDMGLSVVRNETYIPPPFKMLQYSPSIWWRTLDTFAMITVGYDQHVITVNTGNTARGWLQSMDLWHSLNTTVDGNGFIKRASPIARLSSAPEKMADDYLTGFTLSGCVAVNGEAAGVSAERVSVGIYKITGALGLAKEGWSIEVPQDVNGNRLCFVKASTAKDGTITVNVSKRRFDIDAAAIVDGEPIDIPDGRWIDLRLEMPKE